MDPQKLSARHLRADARPILSCDLRFGDYKKSAFLQKHSALRRLVEAHFVRREEESDVLRLLNFLMSTKHFPRHRALQAEIVLRTAPAHLRWREEFVTYIVANVPSAPTSTIE